MPFQLNEVAPLDVVYRHSVSGSPFLPTNHQITVIAPDGTVSTADASRVGSTFIFRRTVTLNQAGSWTWFPVTTDEDITPTTYASLEAGQAWIESLDANLSDLPELAAIVAGVWDELLAGHVIDGSAAQELLTAAAAGNLTIDGIVDGLLAELLSGHTSAGTVGEAISLIASIVAQIGSLGSQLVSAQEQQSTLRGVSLEIGIDYTGGDALVFTSNTMRDLLASGVTVALDYTDNAQAHYSFEASTITGAPGGWQITLPISHDVTETLTPFKGAAQLAVYKEGVEKPKLGRLVLVVADDL